MRSCICLHPPLGGDYGGGHKGVEGSALPTTDSSPDVFPSTCALDQWQKIDQALEAEQLDEFPCYFRLAFFVFQSTNLSQLAFVHTFVFVFFNFSLKQEKCSFQKSTIQSLKT